MSLGTLFNNNKQSDSLILRESMPKSFLRLPQCGDKLKIIVIIHLQIRASTFKAAPFLMKQIGESLSRAIMYLRILEPMFYVDIFRHSK